MVNPPLVAFCCNMLDSPMSGVQQMIIIRHTPASAEVGYLQKCLLNVVQGWLVRWYEPP